MNDSTVKFPTQAEELSILLREDQDEWREYVRKEFEAKDKFSLELDKQLLRQHVEARARRMLEILDEVGDPSISNIGDEAALAISILATHTSLETTRLVLKLFKDLYSRNKANTRYQSIPAMTDWVAILEHKPQIFGTIWLIDKQGYPFLPIVEDFENVNDLRSNYDLDPLSWPKSMAIPEDKQPWLTKPLSDLVMRPPTDDEYSVFERDFLS